MTYVIIANIVVWVGILGYVFFLTKEQKELIDRFYQLEIEIKQDDNDAK